MLDKVSHQSCLGLLPFAGDRAEQVIDFWCDGSTIDGYHRPLLLYPEHLTHRGNEQRKQRLPFHAKRMLMVLLVCRAVTRELRTHRQFRFSGFSIRIATVPQSTDA
jgi:hypothetical protein